MQGVGWLKRKTISVVPLSLHIKQHIEGGVTHIDIGQTAGSIKGTDDDRILDWVKRERVDDLFGDLKVKNRWVNVLDIEDSFLKEGWLDGKEEASGPNEEMLIQAVIEGAGWTVNEVSGFSITGGERRFTRRVMIIKGSERRTVVIYYDFCK